MAKQMCSHGSYHIPHSVTFMEESTYKSVELSDGKEDLVLKETPKYCRPRISSVFFMTDSSICRWYCQSFQLHDKMFYDNMEE